MSKHPPRVVMGGWNWREFRITGESMIQVFLRNPVGKLNERICETEMMSVAEAQEIAERAREEGKREGLLEFAEAVARESTFACNATAKEFLMKLARAMGAEPPQGWGEKKEGSNGND